MKNISFLLAFKYKGTSQSISDLSECINSILKTIEYFNQRSSLKYSSSIYVIDDYSCCNYSDLLPEQIYANIKILPNKFEQGHGTALNYGINSIDADYYIFTDTDCVVNELWLDNIIAFFEYNTHYRCVVGPNWEHQFSKRKWHQFLTKNESLLMQFCFESYIDLVKKSSKRIDCRNLAIKKDFFNSFGGTNVFCNSIYSNSGETSYLWRQASWEMESLVGYEPTLKVLHSNIKSIKKQIVKYYKRGRYGRFFVLYKQDYKSLSHAFFSFYINRHFIFPIQLKKVSPLYLWAVHISFWVGIVKATFNDNKK